MTTTDQVTACVVDHGLFLPLAVRLAPKFKRMLYYSEWRESFPTIGKRLVGDGYKGVERISDYWGQKSDIDLFIFPDIYDGWVQRELANQGKLVFGSRNGDRLEIKRGLFLNTLGDLGLSVPPHIRVVGLDGIRSKLQDVDGDKYIKLSTYRGTMETYHWLGCGQDEPWLDSMALKLGPVKNMVEFFVFDPLVTDLELGADTFCIDGQFPETMLHGLEAKDKGYLGSALRRSKMPPQLKEVLDAFGPALGEYGYRNAFSSEVRVVDGKGYFIDATCRFPMPGTSAQLALVDNLAEIILGGAEGEVVEPVMVDEYAAECVLTSKCEKHAWRIVDFPEKVRPFVNCPDSCEVDGQICFPPRDGHGDEIGWIVATGNTVRETVETMKKRVALLPEGVCACTDSLFDLLKEAIRTEDENIAFLKEPAPNPQLAMDNDK